MLRAMCRCVTCAISCAITPASSLSFFVSSSSPLFTPMKPPGSANALMRVVLDDEEVEALRAVVRLARQARAERADVLGDLGVFEDLILVAQAAHDHAADLVLVFQAEHGLRRAADVRQVLGLGEAARGRAQGQGSARSKQQDVAMDFHEGSVVRRAGGVKALDRGARPSVR